MKLRRGIKRQARAALKGHLSSAAALFLLWVLAYGLVAFADRAVFRLLGYRLEWFGGAEVPGEMSWLTRPGAIWASAALAAARLILLLPLRTGALAWFDGLLRGKRKPLGTLFWSYRGRQWLRSLEVRFCVGAVTWGLTLLPLGAAGAAFWYFRDAVRGLSAPVVALLSALGGVAGLAWVLVSRAFAQRYAMATLLLGPNYGCTAGEALSLSVEYTRGHRWRLLWMDLSFLPWFVSCVLVAPALFVLPYYTACRTEYGRFLYQRQPSRKPDPAPQETGQGEQ